MALVLRVSSLVDAGVGVFTQRAVRKNATLPSLFSSEDAVVTKHPTRMQREFGVKEGLWWTCPKDPTRMCIGWYLNHSASPNLKMGRIHFQAVRDIKAGEELFIDYRTLYTVEEGDVAHPERSLV